MVRRRHVKKDFLFRAFMVWGVLARIGLVDNHGMNDSAEEKSSISIKYTPGTNSSSPDEEAIPDSSYCRTLEKAMKNSSIKLEEGEEYQKNIDEIIKRFENEEYVSIFFQSVQNKKQECFTMAKFKKKIVNEKMKYVF